MFGSAKNSIASVTVIPSTSWIDFPAEPDREDVRLIASAFAFRAAHEDVAEKLHLDLFEAHCRRTARSGRCRR